QGAAGLEAWQLDLMDIPNEPFAEEYDVAVPAVRLGDTRQRDRKKARLPLQPVEVKQAAPLSEPRVGLLEGEDIGSDFLNNLLDAVGVEPAVHAHALVDVVGCNEHTFAFIR